MDFGLALPSSVPGSTAQDLLDWSVEGERAGFSSLAVLDRLVYDNFDCLTTLAAAAAVTERVRLTTAILIGPLHTNTALLAKQVATVDRISGGRLTLGMAVGARPDDFKASGADHARRGRNFTAQLEELRRIWAGERRGIAGAIGPAPSRPTGPELILGGHAPGAVARAARFGDGWISGSGGVGMFTGGAAAFRAAWQQAGRTGKPRLLALAYYSLGDRAEENAKAYIDDYYGFAPPYAQAVLRGTSIGEEAVARTLRAYEEAGCDEVLLVPCSSDLDQVKRLTAVL
ncbi:LLM class flavin-dependent oxidoreductase [Lentzea nigeriaca]|uniref:LLM class flavin-dependent oxidoreductase n=1 Tax=Lentzea nigeriaca TaxID=1128665 RepID=UPI0019585484|nr:LLM class flavin-dependent oxidoreductase [Lentzea nigeriaca]MBM7856359.1 alkanesulfonate monooxygenase SsuD/methylene tetrahydromethanopterin reductase-like flavin-dependent oxidoreductase (luciferase family) [Lentzea nigeriaca]